MKKFFKEYLWLLAAICLAGGSLFAFNISTSIDNALQVIKTIWVTSDGTTNNPPFVTMDGSGWYVSIGTTGSTETLNVAGSVFVQDNEVGFFAGNDATSVFGFPIGGAYMGIDATASSGATAAIVAYDTRAVDPSDGKLWVNIATNSNIGINGAESEASLNTSKGENMDLKVEVWLDLSNYDQQNHSWFVTSQNRSEVSMDADHIRIFTESWTVRTATGSSDNFDYTNSRSSNIEIDPAYLKIYGNGWYADLYFNSSLWLFGFAQNNPGNTVDIGWGYVPGTLGLRFSGRTGNAWQVLGLNNVGDVVLLGPLGGGSSGPWEYGAGSPQSAQIKSAGNTSNGPRAVVGGLNNIGDGYASFVWGGLYNEASSSGNVAVWGAYNKSHWLLLSSIVWGTYNTINSGGNVSFIWGWSDNIINERNSAIVVWSNNIIDAVSSAIVWWEYNTIHSSATQAFIGGGSGNATSGSLSFIGGGLGNIIAWAYTTIVAGVSNILNGAYGFIWWWKSNVLTVWALYSFVGGGENNSVTDRYSTIVWGLNNVNQSEKSFIGWGEGNNIELNSWLSAIVAGSGNTINSGSVNSFIGGGFDNVIQDSFMFGGNLIVWWWANVITNGIVASIVWGYGNDIWGGGGMFIWWGGNNHADGDGMTVVGWSHNWAGSISWTAAQWFIGAGSDNTLLDSSRSSIVWWSGNRIEEASDGSSIAGGYNNNIYNGKESAIVWWSFNTLSGSDFSIVWGTQNFASGTASVVFGRNSQALGSDAFAFGDLAQALHPHTFVWNDGWVPFASTQSNTFLIHASAWVGINTNNTNSKALRVSWSIQADDYYSAPGNPWITYSVFIPANGCTMNFENWLLVSTSGC